MKSRDIGLKAQILFNAARISVGDLAAAFSIGQRNDRKMIILSIVLSQQVSPAQCVWKGFGAEYSTQRCSYETLCVEDANHKHCCVKFNLIPAALSSYESEEHFENVTWT